MSPDKKEVSYVISVSVGKGCYRHIQISSKATFSNLHDVILCVFDFDDDHAHAFFLDNIAWSGANQLHANMIEGESPTRHTSRVRLEQGGFIKDKKFKYVFDFGDNWVFQCKVLNVLDTKTPDPLLIRSVGESPEQYPSDVDDEDEEEEEGEPDDE